MQNKSNQLIILNFYQQFMNSTISIFQNWHTDDYTLKTGETIELTIESLILSYLIINFQIFPMLDQQNPNNPN